MKTLLGVPVDKIDVLKYIMQLRCVILWAKARGRGTIVACTGFGKSFIGLLALKKLVKKNPNTTALVIVPTTILKGQWEEELRNCGLLQNTIVLVVNTVALNTKIYQVDFLIVDEIHLMAAEQFSKIFTHVKYKWILGLTATLKRLDGKERFIVGHAPVLKEIPQKMAIERGWINDFIELNVPVYLTRAEKDRLNDLSKRITNYLGKFDGFEQMQSCMNIESAKAYAALHFRDQDIDEKAKELVRDAVQGQRCVAKRQEFLYKTQHKVDATVDLINEFGFKTITFSQSTDFADEVKTMLGKSALAYHSNLESRTVLTVKQKTYKKKTTAEAYAKKVTGVVTERGEEFIVSWKVNKVLGVDSLKKQALEMFRLNKIANICTAKALDQGFNAPDVQLGIDASRTRNPTQHTQRTGRIARNYTYKDGTKKQGIYINLFIPDSQDEKWLRNCQEGSQNVIWLNSVEECKQTIKKALKL